MAIIESYFSWQDFLCSPKPKNSVEEIVDIIYGKGSWNFIENNAKNYDWELSYDYTQSFEKRRWLIVRNDTDEAQEMIKSLVPKVKQDVLKYATSNNLLPKDFDLKIVLLPPHSRSASSWNPNLMRLELGQYGFECTEVAGKLRVNPCAAYSAVFHEVLGHASHQYHSTAMPLSLQFTQQIGYILPTKIISEGIGMYREGMCLDYIAKSKDEIGLTEDEISSFSLAYKEIIQRQLMDLHYVLVKEKEIRGEASVVDYIKTLTGNAALARMYKYQPSNTFENSFPGLAHALGFNYIKKLVDAFSPKDISIGMLKGDWTWQVYPEFLKLYMKSNGQLL